MSQLAQVLAGIAALVVLSFGAGPLVKRATNQLHLRPPSAHLDVQWKELVSSNEGGAILGFLERLIFFFAIWSDAALLVPAWLAFKVAAKWQVWNSFISMPASLGDVDPLEYLIARQRLGSHLLVTFLVGTAYNIVVALVAVGAAHATGALFTLPGGWHATVP